MELAIEEEDIEVGRLVRIVTILVIAEEMVEVGLGMHEGRDEIEVVESTCMVAVRVPWVSGCAFSTPAQYWYTPASLDNSSRQHDATHCRAPSPRVKPVVLL